MQEPMQQQKIKISDLQAVSLVIHAIVPTAVIVVPTIAIGAASQDAWLSILLSWGLGLLFALLYGAICRLNPGLPFLAFVEQRLGKVVGMIVTLMLLQYFSATLVAAVREFIDFLSDELFMNTPPIVIAAVTLGVALYAVIEGIEVIARASFIVLLGTVFFLPLGMSLEFQEIHIKFLFPIGEASFREVVRGGLSSIGWISEASILLILSPYLKNAAKSSRIGLWGVSLASLQLMTSVLLVLLIFGANLPKIMNYPTFASAEIIKYGTFLERVDVMFICAWISTIYLKICIFYYGTIHCFTHLFRIKERKPFILAIGILVLVTALYSWPNNSYYRHHQAYTAAPFLLTANVALPLLLWMALKWKSKRGQGAEGRA